MLYVVLLVPSNQPRWGSSISSPVRRHQHSPFVPHVLRAIGVAGMITTEPFSVGPSPMHVIGDEQFIGSSPVHEVKLSCLNGTNARLARKSIFGSFGFSITDLIRL